MAMIHHLILRDGRDATLQAADTPNAKRLVDIAAAVMAEEDGSLGITYSGFCMSSLPHKKLPDTEKWTRQAGRFTLLVEPGSLIERGRVVDYGVPYGSRARLILLYLQTQAIRNSSQEVVLGRSMHEWLSNMGVPVGGNSYRDVKEQAARLSACRITFGWQDGAADGYRRDNIVEGGIRFHDHNDRQGQLWEDKVMLSDTFFRALKDHPVPIWEPAVRQIANRSQAIDIYIWLAYRLRVLDHPTPISWAALHAQFGAGYAGVPQFKQRFVPSLQTALAVYPDADVRVDQTGLILHPSRPPIPERLAVAGRR